jgi:hypothetical protein
MHAGTDEEDRTIQISDVRPVGSYSWVKPTTRGPTIIVPGTTSSRLLARTCTHPNDTGAPSVWLDRIVPFQVEPDQALDQNSPQNFPKPLLPIFRAIDSMTTIQHIDWPSIDFVTNRGNLRALLSWADGSRETFRIDTQLAGHKTVLLNRTPRVPFVDPTSFGSNFEKEASRPVHGCENTSSHHRMILYVSRTLPGVFASFLTHLPEIRRPEHACKIRGRRIS